MKRTEAVPPERRILVRIGINVGEIIGDGSDIYGDDVNVAARLDAMAEPSGIYVSRAVRDPVRDKLCFSFEDLGEVAAKNITRPIDVFRVCRDTEAARSKRALPPAMPPLIVAIVAVLWRKHKHKLMKAPPLSPAADRRGSRGTLRGTRQRATIRAAAAGECGARFYRDSCAAPVRQLRPADR